MSRILILGGAALHCGVVETARKMGVETYVTDCLSVEDSPAKQIADHAWDLDIREYDRIIDRCRKEGIDGVLNVYIDPCQIPYQKICEKLGLPCFATSEQYSIFSDKKQFLKTCSENGVDIIEQYQESDFLSDNSDIRYPVYVKPSDSRGSRGQAVCTSRAEVKTAIDAAKKESGNGEVVIERFMEGFQDIQLTYYVIDGEPHLACIAPWEATGDMYRESLAPGGIPCPSFNREIINGVACKNWIDDAPANLEKYPLINEYWEDKIPKWKNIKVPAYVCAGWCHIHLRGSIEGFRRIKSPKKWLRIHREYEWPDAYNPYNLQELTMFFDRYLKDVHNGWELMPKVRLDVMDAFDYDFRPKREEREFPIARTEYRKVYLDAKDGSASYEQPMEAAEVSYDSETGFTTFDFKITEETEVSGYMKLKLWVECRGYDNMDLFVWIKKLGQDGEFLPIWSIREPYRGAWGYCRATHRDLDETYATDFQPVQGHKTCEKFKPGDIVPVEVEIWPHSRIWHPGETLRIEVEGKYFKTEWFEDPKMDFEEDNGGGTHVIHTGGEYDSFLQIPFIPPKYKSGDYELR